MKEYKAAIYLRLSKEDSKANNSIDAQRKITTSYAKKHNYNIVEEYVDNGYSGILSSRPALNRMMVDIVRNKIDMVIVKDMSRLTRDKNLTAYYTDIFFPDNDVRLISVTEYIDTGERYEIDDVVALRGIVNQSYLEDSSKKIKAVKKNFKEQGKFIESSVAYGYKKDENDKYKLVIDENVADIIREIYSSYLNGIKPLEIAKILNERNVETASQYLKLKVVGKYWTKSMVNRILTNPIYAGNMVTNKYENNYRTKKRNTTRKCEYKIIKNTHPAIISQEDYDEVQKRKGNKTKKDFQTYVFLLKGLVYCKHCGRKMSYKNSSPVRINQNGKKTGKINDKGYFICTEHYRHKDVCNEFNKIMEVDLNRVVLDNISNRFKELHIGKYANDVKSLNDKSNAKFLELQKLKREIEKHEYNFKVLYSKKVEGKISEDDFLTRYNQYKITITDLKDRLDKLENSIYNAETQKNAIESIISEFQDCKNFDNTILKKLIDKIEIEKNHNIEISLKV